MTDKRIREDCPFCGHIATDIQLIYCGHNSSGKGDLYEIRCPECGAKFSGYGKQNMIDKWNRRYR